MSAAKNQLPASPQPPLHQADLALMNCQSPSCACADAPVMFLHAKCCYGPTYATYFKQSGVLEIICAKCNRLVARFQIAE